MTSTNRYWSKYLTARWSRRRVLAASGTAVLAAAGAAAFACGDDDSAAIDSGPSGPADKSGLLGRAVDSTKTARKGGVFRHFYASDISNLDPIPLAASGTLRNRIYQKLVMPKPGYQERQRIGEVVPDAAESWEISPDKLTLTFKLRPNNGFDPRPPTNGRILTAEDVVYNFKRVEQLSARRTDIYRSANPDAPVVSYSAPDQFTFVVKFGFPDAGFIANLGTQNSGYYGGLLPANAEETGVNLRVDPRGTGPWLLSRYEPSNTMEFQPNPNYYDKAQPYIERIESPIVPQYPTRLAQFRAGSIYTIPVEAQDIVSTKREIPALNLFESDSVATNNTRAMWGWRAGSGSPFRDERVRQAFSLSQDRDLFIDAIYNVDQFRKEGMPVATRWNGPAIRGTFDGWWLDPQDSKNGDIARFLRYDLAEAKKLLTAAGFPNGIDSEVAYAVGPQTTTTQPLEVVVGMALEAGIRLKLIAADQATDWTSKYYLSKGNYEGMAFQAPTGGADPGNELFGYYNSRGGIFTGFDPDGKGTFVGDPLVDQITTRIRQEFETEKRWALAHELERHEARKLYFPLFPGGAGGFQLAWPAIGNFGVYRGGQTDYLERTWWIDETKAPFKSA